MPQVRNRRTYKGPGIYVGRPSMWGNPYRMTEHLSRAMAIEEYEKYIRSHPYLIEIAKRELRGHDLICWCSPLPCHADVLLKLANEP